MSAHLDEEAILGPLNPAQTRAARTIDGPLMVLAGAGSGKTRVITHRIAWMIHEGVRPDAILGVTFTNKAAREMHRRVTRLTGTDEVRLSTFHSFAAEFLRREFPVIGRGPEFTIYDDGDSLALVRRVVEELDLDPQHWAPSDARNRISYWKSRGVSPDAAARDASGTRDETHARIFARYDTLVTEANACDFDDLLLQCLTLLESHAEVNDRWAERITHVLVDEFQDTNPVQYALVRALTRKHGNVCVTGDPDQSIYSWRGVDPQNFDTFQRDHAETVVVPLERNYRSTGNILETASNLIAHNRGRIPKRLYTDGDAGEPVRVITFTDDYEEAMAIAQAVREWESDGIRRREIAIFYRTNALSLPVERMLIQEDVPYQVIGGLEFFQRQEVKDLMAYLRFLANPRDSVALARIINVPARGIGKKTQEIVLGTAHAEGRVLGEMLRDAHAFEGLTKRSRTALQAFSRTLLELDQATSSGGIQDALESILSVSGYADYWQKKATKSGSLDPYQNIGQLISFAREFDRETDGDLQAFLEQVSLLSDVDRWDESDETISLLTLHSSKGLEFDAVIIIGVEESILPHGNSLREDFGLEEERRLLHVGMTRARRRLVLSNVGQRTRFGRMSFSQPSRFLDELGTSGVEFLGDQGAGSRGGSSDAELEYEDEHHPLAHIRKGVAVRHPEWGLGVVARLRGQGRGLDRKADILFEGEVQRTVALRYADLEIVDDGDGPAF